MSVKLLTEHHLEEDTQPRLRLHLSKCHILETGCHGSSEYKQKMPPSMSTNPPLTHEGSWVSLYFSNDSGVRHPSVSIFKTSFPLKLLKFPMETT